MKVIILICVIVILSYFLYYKESFSANDIVILGRNLVNTKHNIFYGYDKNSAKDIKEKLIKTKKIDMSKSNILINNTNGVVFKNLYLDNNQITSTLFPSFYYSGAGNRKIQFKDNNDNTVLYDHKSQKAEDIPPEKLCIGDDCIERKHLSMLNGNNTIKLKESSSSNYLQPHSVNHSGEGKDTQCENCAPQTNYFYNMASLSTPNCPVMFQDNVKDHVAKYNFFKRFGLQLPDGRYLSVYPNGSLGLTNNIGPWGEFRIEWPFNTYFFEPFIKNNSFMSGPLAIKSNWGRYLCHEKHWLHGCDSSTAVWNRSWVRSWERMMFIRAPLSGGSTSSDLFVYIFSLNCGRVLSKNGGMHFSSQLHNDHSKFRLIPIYDKCSEDCKSNYLSKLGCCGSDEKNIPKNLSCPRDRPICRFYDQQSGILGKCFKESQDAGNIFNQDDPHHCKFAKVNNSGFTVTNVENIATNDTMFNEYTLKIAKNKKGQVYEEDEYTHIHDHSETSHDETIVEDTSVQDFESIRDRIRSEYPDVCSRDTSDGAVDCGSIDF